jgi:hypothetical protein
MDDMLVGISTGRQAHISTDNKEWQAVVGKESRSIGMWDDVVKATYLEFILVGVAKHPLRLHFPLAPKDPNIAGPSQVSTYDPKNKQPPICTSENGVGPSAESRSPQSAFCSNCWAKEWGSALSQRGDKIPACTTKKRLAVIVPSFSWDTVLQFDIPPAAFQNWASLVQILRDGRIARPETVMIRAYFIANEEGFMRFSLSPLGYNEQVHGPGAMPAIHRHMLSSETFALLGGNDKPIDPATWNPALADPAGGGQPALAYTPSQQAQHAPQQAQNYQPQPSPQQHSGQTGAGNYGHAGYSGQAQAPSQPQGPAPLAPPAYSNQALAQNQVVSNPPATYGGAQGTGYGGSPQGQPQGPSQAYAGGGASGGYPQPNQGHVNQSRPVDQAPQSQAYANQPGGGNQYAGYGVRDGSGYQQPLEHPQQIYQVQHGPATGNPHLQIAGPEADYDAVPSGRHHPDDVEYTGASRLENQTEDTHAGASIDGEPTKTRRTRRTKAQIEADNAAEAAAKAAPQSAPQGSQSYGMAQGSPATDALRGQLNNAMGLNPPR